ncbi:MAG: CDGSH iron-sulfur domain-containing protein [Nannocystaceae bacterium]|nr:CDGSH iron-sulfur domain-containing protein [Nannocystaceae bacterium]
MSNDSPDLHKYPGKQLDVIWDRRLCIHVGECGRSEGDFFVGGRTPWCDPDQTEASNAVDVCHRCPTGALSYDRKDGGPLETAADENTVVVASRGPLYIRGELDVAGASDNMESVKFRAALCRCGQSKNKPFCDNSHEASDFKDYGAVGTSADDATATGGPLKVGKAPNGPLLLSGNFSIINSSGRVAFRGTRAALCRCGASKNKPFCDGAHKAAGFEAD